eukprot:s9908_g1.t1
MLTKSVRRTGQPWKLQKALVESIAGSPWNFHLGSLGLKTVPQGRSRAPNPAETAAIADTSLPELPAAPAGGAEPPEAGGIGDVTGLMALPPLGEARGSRDEEPGPAPVSKRATLLLSRGDRTPMTPAAVTPGAVPVSARTPVSESPVQDDAMLDVFLRKRPAGTEAGGEASDSKTARLRRVAGETLAVNDEELEVPSEWDDLGLGTCSVDSHSSQPTEYNVKEHDWVNESCEAENTQQAGILSASELKALESQLWFSEEPTLSPEQQAEVDSAADMFEVQRLIRKGVLKCAGVRGEVSSEGVKRLSTKFVRTWRRKVKDGVEQVLRRSRLCAREYKWLETDRLDIFSPASNTAVSKLLPWLFATMRRDARSEDDMPAMLTLDVKDAYLTVPQSERVRASMPRDYNDRFEYDFVMCIPGQRDGALRW